MRPKANCPASSLTQGVYEDQNAAPSDQWRGRSRADIHSILPKRCMLREVP
jgi:hypothetical protein